MIRSCFFSFLVLAVCFSDTDSFAFDSVQTFLEPYKVAGLAPAGRGRLASLYVKEGDRVENGQLLAACDTDVLQARLALSAKAAGFHGAIDAAKANVKMFSAKLDALEELSKKGNARPQELIMAQTNLVMAKARLLEAREDQQLKEAEKQIIMAQIEENKLYSPFNGTIIAIGKEEGELVGNDKEPIMIVVQLDPLLAVFHLSPKEAYSLDKERPVRLSVNNHSVEGMIEHVSPLIEAQSSTVAVHIIIKNTDEKLVSGSRVGFRSHINKENEYDRKEQQAADQGALQ